MDNMLWMVYADICDMYVSGNHCKLFQHIPCPIFSESDNLANHDFIGACECSLGEVVATQGLGVTR